MRKVKNDISHFMSDENEREEDESEEDESDSVDWKAKYKELGIKNRERTKALKEELARLKETPPKTDNKPDEGLLKRLDDMALKMAGITADDEKELYNKWKAQTGREADDIVSNSIFKRELEDLKIAKANAAATADIKGEGQGSSVKNDPKYWIAKATKGADGKLLFPEETPKELFSQIVETLGEGEPGASKGKIRFYNSK